VTAEHPLLGALLSDTREVVLRLLDESPAAAASLGAELDAFEAELLLLTDHPTADVSTATRLAQGCRALLAAVGPDPARLRMAQIAVRYVVLDEDADGDVDSPYGFDDDVEVFNAVAASVGLGHLALR
jgi:hypothetical protein